MTVFQAIVLGLLQGLAEFLPISSSAHLTLAPWLFGWPDPGLAFDVALHFGTLVAVLWYFRAEWARLVVAAWQIVRTRRVANPEQRRVVYLIIATIPGAIAGKLLEAQAETVFRAVPLVATMLVVMGVILWAVDRYAPRVRPLEGMRWPHAVGFGVAQVFALIPGVSRSGSTITMGRAMGMTREAAAVFSFLMSMPIIAGAAALKIPVALRVEGLSAPLVAGIVAAAISSWLAIAILLRYVTRHSYGIFAWYRVVLGVAVLGIFFARAH